MRKKRLSKKETDMLAEMQHYCEDSEDCRRETFSSKFGLINGEANNATGNALNLSIIMLSELKQSFKLSMRTVV